TTLRKPKTQSEFLSDLLYFHANFFPPPPPPRLPFGHRRGRAELWYHYASKWDITHRLPPPPRTPLPEMALEQQQQLQRFTRTPYHGDRWLKISERWY
ncbi:pterin-4-alpha-carbinolamine dehydratase, partial [Trypanosoma theileri]